MTIVRVAALVYPDQRHRVSACVLDELLTRLGAEPSEADNRVCNGTLLSREPFGRPRSTTPCD